MQSSPLTNPDTALLTRLGRDRIAQVKAALVEDIGSGDITAALIPASQNGSARVITREAAIICGTDWVNEVFRQLNSEIQTSWHVKDGDAVNPGQLLFEVHGSLRQILTGERSALNFLQTLSGTATVSRRYNERVRHTAVRLLDTRKTIPGLSTAQKYAVAIGGCYNHRIGLYDAFLIKENHIAACGGIQAAIDMARHQSPGKPVEIEVENDGELDQAIAGKADIIMLDNFSLPAMTDAVCRVRRLHPEGKVEASGGITDDNLVAIAETGVDYISIGALTKHLHAIDLSMRIT